MHALPLLTLDDPAPPRRLPDWLKRPLPLGNENFFTHKLIDELRLETVCESARCPNRPECWSRRTATFMIMGNLCTRPCGFCSVPRGTPAPQAAGKIHSDIERGFIRAEVVRCEDLLALGSDAKCREAGKLRVEGKDYIVEDGDCVHFRFNV